MDTTSSAGISRKVQISVGEKNILQKDGKSYLIIHRRERSKMVSFLKKVVLNLRKELILKISVILLLIAMKNAEIALILSSILLLRFAGSKKIRINNEVRNTGVLILKTGFLFFYTMFVISADESILVE